MLNQLIQKNQLNQSIIDKLAAPLWRQEARGKQVRSACACRWRRAHDGGTVQLHLQVLTACAARRKQDLLWKDGPKKMSKETEHEKGSRNSFQLGSGRLQAAAMIPGLFPASGYKSMPGRLWAKNISQRDAISRELGELPEKGSTWHIGNSPVLRDGLIIHTLLTQRFAGISFSWEKLCLNFHFHGMKVAGAGFSWAI